MKWTTRAAIQRMLSATPGGKRIYSRIIQRYISGLPSFRVDTRIEQAIRLLDCAHEADETIEGARVVEIGTGWVPAVPVVFWLNGQAQCHTYDLRRQMQPALLLDMLRQIVTMARSDDRALARGTDDALFAQRLRILDDLIDRQAAANAILDALGIHYHAPADAANTLLAGETVDVVVSSAVLEHVSLVGLRGLMAESVRVLRPGGYAVHFVECQDHFACGDPALLTINFLRFSKKEFARYNSAFLFQNRLRPPTYRQLLQEYGFTIAQWHTTVDQQAREHLSDFPLHPDFAAYWPDDLCARTLCVVAKRASPF